MPINDIPPIGSTFATATPCSTCAALRAENERLRGALEQIERDGNPFAARVALAALHPQEGNDE